MAAFDNIQYIDSASINVLSATGSFSGPHTGSQFGTSSWATNARTGSNGAFAWASIWYNGTTVTSTTYNCKITRGAIGSFNVAFVNAAASNQYAVIADGVTGSAGLATITASLISPVFLRTNGFTMSVQKWLAATQPVADFTSASVAVFSFF